MRPPQPETCVKFGPSKISYLLPLCTHTCSSNIDTYLCQTSQKSNRKSQATQAKESDTKRARFKILHAEHKDPAQLFDLLSSTAGYIPDKSEVDKVREHNNQLDRVFGFLELSERMRAIVAAYWEAFTSGMQGTFASLQRKLELTNEADQDKITTLIRCAHSVRFPSDNPSGLSNEEMLAAIEGSTPPTKKILTKADRIEWSTAIVQEGFRAEYEGHDLIVLPTLKTLTEFAGLWQRNAYKAPYTSIVGPTMSGNIYWPAPSFRNCKLLPPTGGTEIRHAQALYSLIGCNPQHGF
ncbi:uncharacterized protein PGTG_21301 [Puccinia graminis f. sp. tritici CRL 75-36-700-3]|uniref:Uncharacterized protein n=1 Tax=Puccinia graminis f. sp. tritici (strain CRL 75-36-700-3 / race SCCL) TaxID=418459 RepID=H6QR34_PUCGT|nr:uncharacterized protein PGTG_21301 [Puccinia graminis f. sp. tritici CRL 75-36-700-3]EHS63009.1 hypothetical protein PGTG_21301 [Puccinia graminis f. sp. tritici CRL 75-36-700-3]